MDLVSVYTLNYEAQRQPVLSPRWWLLGLSPPLFYCSCHPTTSVANHLKGLSHEIDFKNVDENGQILALLRAAAGF